MWSENQCLCMWGEVCMTCSLWKKCANTVTVIDTIWFCVLCVQKYRCVCYVRVGRCSSSLCLRPAPISNFLFPALTFCRLLHLLCSTALCRESFYQAPQWQISGRISCPQFARAVCHVWHRGLPSPLWHWTDSVSISVSYILPFWFGENPSQCCKWLWKGI